MTAKNETELYARGDGAATPGDRVAGYEYYSLAGVMPIRILLGKNGGWIGAEVPDRESGGLKMDPRYMSRVLASMEVDELDEAGFNDLCAQYYARANGGPAPAQ